METSQEIQCTHCECGWIEEIDLGRVRWNTESEPWVVRPCEYCNPWAYREPTEPIAWDGPDDRVPF